MKPRKGRGSWKGFLAALAMAAAVAGCGSSSEVELSEGGGSYGPSSFVSSPSELGVGDAMIAEFAAGEAVLDFSGVGTDSKFILAVGSSSEYGTATTIQLAPSIGLMDPSAEAKAMDVEAEYAADDGYGVEEIFSAWLRAAEMDLDLNEVPADMISLSSSKAMAVKAVSLGQREIFRVLANLSSPSSYVEVTGNARHIGSNVVCYVDNRVSDDSLSEADISKLCGEFDAEVGEMASLLGDSSDVDGDGKLHVLMTPQINRLGALGGGIVTGYFYAADLYARSGSNPVSNLREIIYTLVPDSSGEWGTPVEKAFAMSNLLPAVLPHELQHAISYNQHVFVNGGAPEDNWLNEALSHFIEDYMGHGRENPSRYALYLASPSTYGIVTQGSPNLLERGGSYLFLRYLYEQAPDGDAFLSRLVRTGRRGVDNLLEAFQGPADMDEFREMMERWSIALAMTDRGISSDSRFVYRPRVRDAETGEWKGVCLECTPDDGRGTVLEGVHLNQYFGYLDVAVDGASAKYFDVSTIPNRIQIQGATAQDSYAILVRYQ
ncbi:MAG: hypothetical protein JXA24_06140 [Proteobacteria bacterium]|nr:hypothetical protein [Pseudomonadota bacterium]